MTEEKLRRVHTVYGIIMSILVVFLGICFITSCITIYLSGDRPFTRESVGNQLGTILIPILLCAIGIIGNVILSFYPLESSKLRGKIDHGVTLLRLKSRCDFENCPPELLAKIKREKKQRIAYIVVSSLIYAVSLTVAFIYCFNQSNFPSVDITDEVARAVLVILCCTIASFATALGAKALFSASISRELEITKKVLGVSKKTSKSEEKPQKKQGVLINIARGVILALAIIFIIIGISNGGMADVLGKAVRICTECIGLG